MSSSAARCGRGFRHNCRRPRARFPIRADRSLSRMVLSECNPRQSDPKSPLGAENGVSRYADLRSKMSQLAAFKAAAVLFVNDPYAGKKAAENRREGLAKANEKVVTLVEEFLMIDATDREKIVAARNKLTEAVNQSITIGTECHRNQRRTF